MVDCIRNSILHLNLDPAAARDLDPSPSRPFLIIINHLEFHFEGHLWTTHPALISKEEVRYHLTSFKATLATLR